MFRSSLRWTQGTVSALTLLAGLVVAWPTAAATSSVWTGRNDNARSGANLEESQLTTNNVNPSQFGKLFTFPVDGQIYAQPLYASNVTIKGVGRRHVVFVATMENTLYAVDANQGTLLWKRDFKNPSQGITPVPMADIVGVNYGDITATNVGIQSTPVLDTNTGMLYVLVRSKERGSYFQRLHAIDITSGATSASTVITATYKGRVFDPRIQLQRAGLALAKKHVIITWGSHQDSGDYSGWVMGYDKSSLAQTGVFATATTTKGAAIWSSGRAPAVMRNGDVVVFTGNGIGPNGYDGVNNFAESVLRLRPGKDMSLVDWFTPDNWAQLDAADADLGGSGPTLVTSNEYIVGGGKEGVMYVIDPSNMGQFSKGNARLKQSMRLVPQVASGWHHIMGGVVLWDRRKDNGSLLMYNWGESDRLRAWRWSGNGNSFEVTPVAVSGMYVQDHPGGILALSANGTKTGTGIVWSLASNAGNAIHGNRHGVLRAFNAENLAQELWNSDFYPEDDLGLFAKFNSPTIANGRVYAATFSNQLVAYGLLSKPRPAVSNSYVKIVSRLDTAKVLEVASGIRAEGTRLQLGVDRGLLRQRWQMVTSANGDITLVSALNGMAVDTLGGAQAAGTSVGVWPRNPASLTQKWNALPTQAPYGTLALKSGGQVLEVLNNNPAAGTQVRLWTPNRGVGQDWAVVPAPAKVSAPECDTESLTITSAQAAGRVLSTAASGVANQTSLEVRAASGAADQVWRLTAPTGTSGYVLTSVSANRVATLSSPTPAAGLSVMLNDWVGQAHQRWMIWPSPIANNASAVVMEPLQGSGLMFSVLNNAMTDPAAVGLMPYAGNVAFQSWTLQDKNKTVCSFASSVNPRP